MSKQVSPIFDALEDQAREHYALVLTTLSEDAERPEIREAAERFLEG